MRAHSEGSVDLVMFDTEQMREIGRRTMSCSYRRSVEFLFCPDTYVLSDGLVFSHTRKGVFGWNPAGRSGESAEWFAIQANDVMQAHRSTVLHYDYDSGDFSGLGPDWTVADADENDRLSYDGQWLLDGSTIRSISSPVEKVTFDPPGQVIESQFDTSGSVLFSVALSKDRFQVFACDAANVECEPLSDVGAQPFRLVNTDS